MEQMDKYQVIKELEKIDKEDASKLFGELIIHWGKKLMEALPIVHKYEVSELTTEEITRISQISIEAFAYEFANLNSELKALSIKIRDNHNFNQD